jgi:hypothetical protein
MARAIDRGRLPVPSVQRQDGGIYISADCGWYEYSAQYGQNAGGVVNVSSHVHNYQRSFPLTFSPQPQPDGAVSGPRG